MAVFDGGVFDSGVFDAGGATTVESSFSANAFIEGWFSASSVLRRGQSSSFTADETTRKPQSGSFAAASVVLRDQPGSLTADAWKYAGFDLVEGGFAADAVVLRAQDSSFAAAAITLEAQSNSLTADAIPRLVRADGFGGYSLVLRTTEGSFSAAAITLQLQGSTFTADATIPTTWGGGFDVSAWTKAAPITGSFTTSAIIAVEALYDDFNRTVPEGTGLGGQWLNYWGQWWYTDNYTHYTETYDSVVDGFVTQPAHTDNGYTSFPKIRYGLVQYDFKLGPSFGDGWLWTGIDIWDKGDGAFWEVEIWDEGDGTLAADVWPSNAADSLYVPAVPGVWYTLKALVNSFADEDVRLKIWERGTPEPDWQWNSTSKGRSIASATYSYLELEGHHDSAAYYDNIRFLAFESGWKYDRLFNAYAWIIEAGKRTGTFYAKSEIYSPARFGAFSADARLGHWDTFSAAAVIRREIIGRASYIREVMLDDPAAFVMLDDPIKNLAVDSVGPRYWYYYGFDESSRAQGILASSEQFRESTRFNAKPASQAIQAARIGDPANGNSWWTSGDATIEVWVDVPASGTYYGFVAGTRSATSQFYILRLYNSNVFEIRWGNSAGTYWTCSPTILPGIHHIVARKSGALLTAWVDGAQVGSPVTTSGTFGLVTNSTGIGYDPYYGWQFGWASRIQAVAFYDNALADSRIATHHTIGVGVVGFTADAYVARWFSAKAIIAPYEGWRYGEIAADSLICLPWVVIESSFSADAITRVVVGGGSPVWFTDEFRRVIPEWEGWGESWVTSDRAAVDGEHGYVPIRDSAEFENPDIPNLDQYELQLVFRTQPLYDDTGWMAYIYLEYGELWADIWPYDRVDSDPFLMDFTLDGDQRITESVLLSTESWYTLKLLQTDTNGYLKVWKVGDTEPDEWLITVGAISNWDMSFYMDVEGSEISSTYVDRLVISVPGSVIGGQGVLSFTADAEIHKNEFTADALLSIQFEDVFLATAVISASHFTVHFAANAVIKKTVAGTPKTADAHIHGRYVRSVVASAQIDNPPERIRNFSADSFFVHATFTANALIQWYLLANAQIIVRTVRSIVAKALFKAVPVVQYAEATMDSWVIGTVDSFTADAQVSSPTTESGSFAAEAYISLTYRRFSIRHDFVALVRFEDAFLCRAEIVGGYFRADARIMPVFKADAFIALHFKTNACLRKPRSGTLTTNAIVKAQMGPVVGESRIIKPALIKFDIWWSHWNNLSLSSAIQLRRDSVSGTLLWAGTPAGVWWVTSGRQFHTIGEYLDTAPTTGKYVLTFATFSYPADFYTAEWSFWIDGYNAASPPLRTVYKNPVVACQPGIGSEVAITGAFLDTNVPVVTADAWIREEEDPGGWTATGGVTADAVKKISPASHFHADSVVYGLYPTGSFTANAVILAHIFDFSTGAVVLSTIFGEVEPAALIVALPSSFVADAFIARRFYADAFVQPWFSADAFIRREFASRLWFAANAYIYDPRWFTANAYLYKPGVVNPPPEPPPDDGDPNPPPTPPPPAGPPPQYSKIRILIKSGGATTDITKDVVWNETEFTQAAKTAPGTFRCTLRGEFTQYDGGEDIYVEIDGFRQFGGLVTMVEYDYFYPNVAIPKTVLLGTDYNIYFDKLVLWNREENPGTGGSYINARGYRAGLSDQSIIRHVCWHMIDLPPGFDLTHVDLLDEDWLDGERYYFNTGMSFREFMSEMSRVTAGVWWIDQFLALHYHARGVATAPAAITDTQAGVSCRNLEWRGDAGSMVNDIFVWGTLATTVAGKIVLTRRDRPELIATHGLRQYAEFRSDLHDPLHIQKRANSIKTRRGIIMETASLDIFEGGFTAGQVVQVNMTTFGKARLFVIRQVQTRFATMAPPDGTTYYGVPIYHLELGLDPEDPWNFYDMLPFDIPPWDTPFGFVFPQWGGFEICQSESATDNEFIAHTVTFFEEDGMGFGDIWPTEGSYWPLSLYESSSPYKWGPLAGPSYQPTTRYTSTSLTPTYAISGGQNIPMLFGANMGGHMRRTMQVISHYEYATPLREGLYGIDASAMSTGTLSFYPSGELTYPLGIDLNHQSGNIGGGEWSVQIGVDPGGYYNRKFVWITRGMLTLKQSPYGTAPTGPYAAWQGWTKYSGALYYSPYTYIPPSLLSSKTWTNQNIPGRFWLRIRIEDDCIRVKIWDMCGPEPDHWMYETDSCPVATPLLAVGSQVVFDQGYQQTGTPEVQFSAIELSSSSGTGYLTSTTWGWFGDPPYHQNDWTQQHFDINDHSGPWPNGVGTLQQGGAWVVKTSLPHLPGDWRWTWGTWPWSVFSTNDPATGTVYDRSNPTAAYLPKFSFQLNWPLYSGWDNPAWVTSEMVNTPYPNGPGACYWVNYTLRSVLRPSWAPYTFHFSAEVCVSQSQSLVDWYFPDKVGNGFFGIRVFRYTGGLDCPTVDNQGRIIQKEVIADFSWYGALTLPVWIPIEFEHAFTAGESVFTYGIEVTNEWGSLVTSQGYHAFPLGGVDATRNFWLAWRNENIWLTHGDPTPDPLDGITRLPGIYAPLENLPLATFGSYTFHDSGGSSLAVRDMPRWGWFTETVMVNHEGYFISTGGYVRGSFSVWYTGEHLVPEKDWVSVGPVGGMGSKLWRFQLTATYRAKNPGVGMVSLTYLIDNPAADPAWTRPSRSTVTDVLADRNRMIDIRGLN